MHTSPRAPAGAWEIIRRNALAGVPYMPSSRPASRVQANLQSLPRWRRGRDRAGLWRGHHPQGFFRRGREARATPRRNRREDVGSSDRVDAWGTILVAGRSGPAWAQEVPIERAGARRGRRHGDRREQGRPARWLVQRPRGRLDGRGRESRPALRSGCHSTKPGRPSRLSRAFGIDGRKTEAIVMGLWIRTNQIQHGERTRGPCPA